jgi:hypothetical protein
MYDAFLKMFHDKYDIYLYTNTEANDYHNLSKKYNNVLLPGTITGTFHLGFMPNQPYDLVRQTFINRYCLKIVCSILDIIALRGYEHQKDDVQRDNIVRLGFKLSDAVIAISDYSANDYKAYFLQDEDIQDKPIKVVYPTSEISIACDKTHNLPFDEFFLIMGNSFKHKAIKEAISAVSKTEHKYIVLGYGDNSFINPNVYGYASGRLSEDFISYLYSNCKALIYPSLYEGFGIPVVIAFKNKKRVILYNCELNRELQKYFNNFKEYFIFFDKLSEIGDIVNNINFNVALPQIEYMRTWKDAAKEMEPFFESIIDSETDVDKLNERWNLFSLLEDKAVNIYKLSNDGSGNSNEVLWKLLIKGALSEKCPRIFSLLKKIRSIRTQKVDFGSRYNVLSEKIEYACLNQNNDIRYAFDRFQKVNLNGTVVVNIHGWAFHPYYSTDESSLLIVLQKDDLMYLFDTIEVLRPDVALAHNEDADVDLENAGFNACIPKEMLPKGKYKIGFCVKSNNGYHYKMVDNISVRVGISRVIMRKSM